MHYGGAMGAKEARKFERFVDLCDVFHLPIINFADQPGFVIGRAGESEGTLRAGVRASCAIDDSRVPWGTVVVRRLYGVAGGAHQDFSRFCFRIAWPSAEWGSLPIEGGVDAAYRREIDAAPDPAARRKEIEQRLIALRSPFSAAEAFAVEDIASTRARRGRCWRSGWRSPTRSSYRRRWASARCTGCARSARVRRDIRGRPRLGDHLRRLTG